MIHLMTHEAAAGAYPAVVVLGAALLWFLVCGTVLFGIDLREHRLPNRWTGLLWAGAFGCLLGSTLIAPDTSVLAHRWHLMLLGSIGYLLVMVVLHLVTRGGIGMGDVKLAAGLGLYTGFLGVEPFLAAIVLAFIIGGLQAVYLVVFRGAARSTRIAFGPAMLIGCTLTMLM